MATNDFTAACSYLWPRSFAAAVALLEAQNKDLEAQVSRSWPQFDQ
jgi:hypothetical protein